jgi:hypothetical protein
MSRPNPTFLLGFLVAVWAILSAVALAKGGFFLAKHEGDTLHLMQIVFRMVGGEWPHLDFMTPIGIMAFAPIVMFIKLGIGVGHAILLSQSLVALLLLPALFWIGLTRLQGALAYLFGAVVLVLVLALVFGETERSVSISMHYNRWAWALGYVAIAAAMLPPRETRNETIDGVIIGLSLAMLALCKITYFAAFLIPILVALGLRGAWRTILVAAIAGLGVALIVTLMAGVGFWPAYLGDLMTVAGSDIRPQPGAPLRSVIGAPAYLGGSLMLFLGIILLRQSEQPALGLGLLLLAPGFFYVTYQNFGNDPQWLMLVALFLLVPQPRADLVNGLGWNMRRALSLTAVATIAFAAPSMLNLAYSPFRHLGLKAADYAPMLKKLPEHADLRSRIVRSNKVDGLIAMDGPGSGLEAWADLADRGDSRTVWQDEELPICELQSGLIAWFEAIVADLEGQGFAKGKRLFAADIFSSHWLFGDLKRLSKGAPWYYGGLPGFQSADYLLVPLCPASVSVRKETLAAIEKEPVSLTELRRTPLYILYGIGRD